jgi:hypothetical protein
MGQVKTPTVVVRKAPERRMSGHDISHELHLMLVELDGICDDDEEAICEWTDRFHELIGKSRDKMFAYRKAISIAKSRQEFFQNEQSRYSKRAKQQKGVAEHIKELANLMSARHYETTGEKKIPLEDGTAATFVLKDAYEFHLEGQPGVPVTPYDVPTEFLREPQISVSALKRAAADGTPIEGVAVRAFKKGHVRWS